MWCPKCRVQFTEVVNGCKFGGTKEIVYIKEAFKSHRIFLEHQHDDGPHVSNNDKL